MLWGVVVGVYVGGLGRSSPSTTRASKPPLPLPPKHEQRELQLHTYRRRRHLPQREGAARRELGGGGGGVGDVTGGLGRLLLLLGAGRGREGEEAGVAVLWLFCGWIWGLDGRCHIHVCVYVG